MAAPLLAARGIHKRYPGVHALAGADLEVHAGEVHALVGENGAGKSTLMKILSGAVAPDDGTLEVGGRAVRLHSPRDAHALGIRMIHQELSLVPALSVAENILLGAEPTRMGLVHRRALRDRCAAVLDRLGQRIPLDAPVGSLSLAQRQMVEIAKAISRDARVLIMDEPTAILPDGEVSALFALVRQLRGEGMAVIHISHRLEEIFRIADRVTVLRDGAVVHSAPVDGLTREAIVRLMVGRELAAGYPPPAAEPGPELLRVRGLSRGFVRDVNLVLRAGEVLGLVGLVGSGRSELARAIFGADARDAGEIELAGRRIDPRSPREAIDAGIALLPEDRKTQGLILHDLVRRNVALATLAERTRGGLVDERRERAAVDEWVESLRIRTPGIDRPVRLLSGGNQQKVVLARWMLARSRVIIFDEPTRGVDVGAKAEIYALVRALTARGAGVILISSDLPEALGMSDRVLVMREGRVAAELARAQATPERVGELMMPVGRSAA